MEPRSQRLVTEAKIDAVVDTSVAAAVPPEVTAQVEPLVSQAIVDTVIEAYDPFQPTIETDIAFAVVDEGGRRTWLEAGLDGAPTTYSASKIAPAVSPAVLAEIGVEEQDPAITGLAFAVVDDEGRRTELEVGEDGRFTQRVVDSLGVRIGGSLVDPLVSGPAIACYGDSLTAGAGGSGTTWPGVLATLTTHPVSTHAVGGDGAESIAARQGGTPLMLRPTTGEIPASGAVNVTLQRSGPYAPGTLTPYGSTTGFGNTSTLKGVLAGVHGTLAKVTDSITGEVSFTFTRTTAGDVVAFKAPPQPFYTDSALARRSDLHIYWSGNNYPESYGADLVVAYLQAMTEWQSDGDRRYLILGLVTDDTRTAGEARFDIAMEANRRLSHLYGRRFVDIRHYLREYGLADAGITPTAEDDAAYASGALPASLRTDSIHLNATGYTLVANHVHARLSEMGWL